MSIGPNIASAISILASSSACDAVTSSCRHDAPASIRGSSDSRERAVAMAWSPRRKISVTNKEPKPEEQPVISHVCRCIAPSWLRFAVKERQGQWPPKTPSLMKAYSCQVSCSVRVWSRSLSWRTMMTLCIRMHRGAWKDALYSNKSCFSQHNHPPSYSGECAHIAFWYSRLHTSIMSTLITKAEETLAQAKQLDAHIVSNGLPPTSCDQDSLITLLPEYGAVQRVIIDSTHALKRLA